MNILEFLKENILILDGGMGTLLQQKGLGAGEYPELWNISHPDVIKDIHLSYFKSGSHVICTNTFGANSLKFSDSELEDIISGALAIAKSAREESGLENRFIALDIGPVGKLLKPFGDLDFEDAVGIFKKTATLGEKYGADLIFIETMSDSYETKAALLAAKECSALPVFISNAYGADGKLLTGATPAAMAALAEGLGADAVGANCSLGPSELREVAKELLAVSSIPVILKPNAGLPAVEGERTVYNIGCDEFTSELSSLVDMGVRVVGGCCGTTPEYIASLSSAVKDKKPCPVEEKNLSVVSSFARAVYFGKTPALIGERINPNGKPRFKEALRENDISYIVKEGISQEECGVHILDVNVGLPEINEPEMLTRVTKELQAVTPLPLQLDTSDAAALEAAMRIYNGKPMVNSVNGKEESMAKVFPLVKKYGGFVVALTLDENGIPESAEGRLEVARKILRRAKDFGLREKDLIFDPLAMSVSADANSATVTTKALRLIKTELGCNTILGVSNISFGLPKRDKVNSTFFTLALESGLSAAIMNPHSEEMMNSYHTFKMLRGFDTGCAEYIKFATSSEEGGKENLQNDPSDSPLRFSIIKGLLKESSSITEELLKTKEALTVINEEIIPALDFVGRGFESGKIYLPGLLMSAEAAKSAFEVIRKKMPKNSTRDTGKCKIVLATVEGDIHDIGKNMVKLLLENYGFSVFDLGRDVKPERVLEAAKSTGARIVGLSALMTTTVPAMKRTLELIKNELPEVKVVVGGAVLNEEYAKSIGADKYAKDAMETVRYAESIIQN